MKTQIPLFGVLSKLVVVGLVSCSSAFAESPWDPIEPVNREIFSFNDFLDRHIAEPVARGYDDITPAPVHKGITNFFKNLRYPSYLVSDVIQLKFGQVLSHTARFIVNSSVGLLGTIDVAKDIGLEDHEEDMGTALAYHGIPSGPYLVLPILGPSNVRDAIGLVADSFLNPLQLIFYTNMHESEQWAIYAGTRTVQYTDIRANLLEAFDTAKESSVDYYLFMQGAYYQHRAGVIYDGHPPLSEDDEDFGNEKSDTEKAEKTVSTLPIPMGSPAKSQLSLRLYEGD